MEPLGNLNLYVQPCGTWNLLSVEPLWKPEPFKRGTFMRNLVPGFPRCPKPPRSFIGKTPSFSSCWGKHNKHKHSIEMSHAHDLVSCKQQRLQAFQHVHKVLYLAVMPLAALGLPLLAKLRTIMFPDQGTATKTKKATGQQKALARLPRLLFSARVK